MLGLATAAAAGRGAGAAVRWAWGCWAWATARSSSSCRSASRRRSACITGIVGAAGGVGGFFLPNLFGILKELTGSFGSGFLPSPWWAASAARRRLTYVSRGWQGVFIGQGGLAHQAAPEAAGAMAETPVPEPAQQAEIRLRLKWRNPSPKRKEERGHDTGSLSRHAGLGLGISPLAIFSAEIIIYIFMANPRAGGAVSAV